MGLDPDDMAGLDWHEVILAPKSQCRLMRIVRFFLGASFDDFWTTYRVPLCETVIAHPDDVADPEKHTAIIRHELHHVKQLAPWYGPLWMAFAVSVFPLPVLFSGRWWIERRAYLDEIKQGLITVEEAVNTLWFSYGWPWPPSLMRKWFERRVGDAAAA